jgi:hypothetical protein
MNASKAKAIKKSLFIFFLAASSFVNAQNISINNTGTAADPSAMLDISSNSKGLLIPRMTKTQRAAIAVPKNGLLVYDSSTASFWFYKQNQWQELASNTTTSDSSLTYGQQTGTIPSYNLNAITHNTIVSDSSGFIYDSGGPAGNYGNNEDYVIAVYSTIANIIGYKVQVISNSLENPFDTLSIQTGGAFPILEILTGTQIANYTFDNGPFIVHFKSNASNTAAGFKIRWDVIFPPSVPTSNPPMAGWYYSPEKLAMHGGYNFNSQWNNNNSGFTSFNYGYGNKAGGDYATALGYYTNAPGKYATALGHLTSAWGDHSIAMGENTYSSGIASTAFGSYTTAQGDYSTASGTYTSALGYLSTTWGTTTVASGYNATAFGSFTTASQNNAVAWGTQSSASGFSSTAFGTSASASGSNAVSIGVSTIASGDQSMALGSRVSTNSMMGSFAIGDGFSYATPLNNDAENQMLMRFGGGYKFHLTNALLAMTIDPDGNVGIGTSTPLARLHVTDNSVLFSATGNLPGQVGAPPVSGAGRRAMWYVDKAAFRTGYVDGTQWNQNSIGDYSFASGNNTTASGSYAFAIGNGTNASGTSSTAMGYISSATGISSTALGQGASASGLYSTAIGYNTIASGSASTAIGSNAIASGNASTVIGESITARSAYETVFGSWNIDYTPSNPFGWSGTDRLFVVGNGTGTGTGVASSNALTVLKNGNMGIGKSNPLNKVHIVNGVSGATAFSPAFTPLVVENNGHTYINLISPEANETAILFGKPSSAAHGVIMYNNASTLNGFQFRTNLNVTRMIIDNAGNVGINTIAPGEKLEVNGNIKCVLLMQTSDSRLKRDIVPIQNSLEKIKQLNGYNYYWKNEARGNSLQTGVLAQEVQRSFPNLVKEDAQGMLSVNYSGLIPVLIESIKEQQHLIEKQQLQIDELKKIVEKLVR